MLKDIRVVVSTVVMSEGWVKVMKYDVNIDLANSAKKEMEKYLNMDNSRVINKFGAFASLYELDLQKYENPILVLKTEEPGQSNLLR